MSRFQWLLRTAKHMFSPYHPPKRPSFLADDELEIRRAAARDLLGEQQIKPRFPPREVERAGPKPVHDWPRDGNGSPIDYDDLPA